MPPPHRPRLLFHGSSDWSEKKLERIGSKIMNNLLSISDFYCSRARELNTKHLIFMHFGLAMRGKTFPTLLSLSPIESRDHKTSAQISPARIIQFSAFFLLLEVSLDRRQIDYNLAAL
jgi:hypothetical protein